MFVRCLIVLGIASICYIKDTSDTVETLQKKANKKKPIYFYPRFHYHPSELVSYIDKEAERRKLICTCGYVPKRRDIIRATEPFKTHSIPPRNINIGMVMKIIKIDCEGDLFVFHEKWNKSSWIARKDFNKIVNNKLPVGGNDDTTAEAKIINKIDNFTPTEEIEIVVISSIKEIDTPMPDDINRRFSDISYNYELNEPEIEINQFIINQK